MTEQEWCIEFGHRLQRMYGKPCNYKKRNLAEMAGLSTKTVGRYMRGERVPDAINLRKIARALNCTVDELLPDEEITE
jgi:transcriptional regulator with XRE-family HTH domain